MRWRALAAGFALAMALWRVHDATTNTPAVVLLGSPWAHAVVDVIAALCLFPWRADAPREK